MAAVLEVQNVCKSFETNDNKNDILKNINLSVMEGEFVTIMGPSGSGKSTLLYSVSGMDQVDSGKIILGKKDLAKCNEKELTEVRRSKMGFVFQQPNLLKNLSILDNIVLTAVLKEPEKIDEIHQRAKALMKKAGIEGIEDRDIKSISGGQAQRVGICRALINKPKILFADEPTGALNSKMAKEIMTLLKEINEEGMTLLMVTHDVKVAAQSDRVLFMVDGKIMSEAQLGKSDGRDLEERMATISRTMQRLSI